MGVLLDPGEVARRLAGLTVPWYVAAGWALDLFRGRQTREHGDIEIAVPAATFPAVHQTWLRDPATGSYLLLPPSLFDHQAAELFGDDSAGLCGHRAPIRVLCHAPVVVPPTAICLPLPAVMRSREPRER